MLNIISHALLRRIYDFKWTNCTSPEEVASCLSLGTPAIYYRPSNIGLNELLKICSAVEGSTCQFFTFSDVNNLGDKHAEILAEMIERNDRLVVLCLGKYNALTNIGLKLFAESLQKNYTLEHFPINSNYFGNGREEVDTNSVEKIVRVLVRNNSERERKVLVKKNLYSTFMRGKQSTGTWNRANMVIIDTDYSNENFNLINILTSEIQNMDVDSLKIRVKVQTNPSWEVVKEMSPEDVDLAIEMAARHTLTKIVDPSMKSELAAWRRPPQKPTTKQRVLSIVESHTIKARMIRDGVISINSEKANAEVEENRTFMSSKSRRSRLEDSSSSFGMLRRKSSKFGTAWKKKRSRVFNEQLFPLPRFSSDTIMVKMSRMPIGQGELYKRMPEISITKGSTYCLTFNLRNILSEDLSQKREAIEELRSWFNVIRSFAPAGPFLFVGIIPVEAKFDSFGDAVRKADEIIKEIISKQRVALFMSHKSTYGAAGEFQPVRNVLPELEQELLFFPLCQTLGSGLEKVMLSRVKSGIEEVLRDLESIYQQIPLKWVRCYDKIIRMISVVNFDEEGRFLRYAQVSKIANDYGVPDQKDVKAMISFFHAHGLLCNVKNELIFEDPKWFMQKMYLVFYERFNEHNDKLGAELWKFGLVEEFEQFKTNSLISRDLLEFFWGRSTCNIFILAAVDNVFISKVVTQEQDELYVVPSRLPHSEVELKLKDSTFYFDFGEMHEFLVFKEGFFLRVISMLLQRPQFSSDYVFTKTYAHLTCREQDIHIGFENKRGKLYLMLVLPQKNQELTKFLVSTITSLLKKINLDLSSQLQELPWTAFVASNDGEFIPLEIAMAQGQTPWTELRSNEVSNEMLEVDSFLYSL